ncbi:MAG TPA: isoaspartyl peptidase/L-asparaginase [Solirubrobacteraceae bacterium]|nr:isoaspartyl peptidase/L-asparaginase [Solirubrobacteraceae bacterium]
MSGPVILVHAGAGGISDDLREQQSECRAALEQALAAGAAALDDGGAVDAVSAAVMVMEGFPLFNAGYGSVLCSDGSVEMSAAIMRGSDRAAGAVATLRRTRHPVAAALSLLEAPPVLLAGEPADAHAAGQGLEQHDPSEFVTARQRRRLARWLDSRDVSDRGTVGAVCLDATGLLAAATSTGGRLGQRPGRVGDSPLIGAGTWADRSVAVSCTGAGEAFIRCGAARLLGALVGSGVAVESAAGAVLGEVADCDGVGGLIAVDATGDVAMPFSTDAMPRGVWRPGQGPVVQIP